MTVAPLLLAALLAIASGALLRPPSSPASRLAPPRSGSLSGLAALRLRRATTLSVLGAAMLFAPPLGVAAALWWWARPRLATRRAARSAERQVEATLPDTVDLLALCACAGWSVPLSVPLVGAQATGPVGAALVQAGARSRQGAPLADALVESLHPLGDRAAGLAHLLADHLRYGTPLVPGLDRLGLELRMHRRRQAEQRARRLPVRLLLPLVTCILPAFALLTVVPLLVGSLRSLSL